MKMIIFITTVLFFIAISLMIWDVVSERESFAKGYWCGYFLAMAITFLILILTL